MLVYGIPFQECQYPFNCYIHSQYRFVRSSIYNNGFQTILILVTTSVLCHFITECLDSDNLGSCIVPMRNKNQSTHDRGLHGTVRYGSSICSGAKLSYLLCVCEKNLNKHNII